MKIKFSISSKLLLLILPLVCFLISAVGYFSIQESTERVNHLVRQELLVEVKAIANKINYIFYYCRMDLETISHLPVLEEYLIARAFRLETEAEFNYDNIVRIFNDFIVRTPNYFQIRYLDKKPLPNIREGLFVDCQGRIGKSQDRRAVRFMLHSTG